MTASSADLHGRTLQAGSASGGLLRLEAPLSFWGGVDDDGRVIDPHHPQVGASLAGRILAMPSGRGSSSSSSVLAELLRSGRGPAAVLMAESDAIVALGAIVAHELYATATPVVVVDPGDFDRLPYDGDADVIAEQQRARIRLR